MKGEARIDYGAQIPEITIEIKADYLGLLNLWRALVIMYLGVKYKEGVEEKINEVELKATFRRVNDKIVIILGD